VDPAISALGQLLYDSALLESGFAPADAKGFTSRVQVGGALGRAHSAVLKTGGPVLCAQRARPQGP